MCAILLPASADRIWSDGPLTASDFGGGSASDSTRTHLSASLRSSARNNIKGEATLFIEAVVNPTLSTGGNALTPGRLAYHQLQYDLLELCGRGAQEALRGGESPEKVIQKYEAYYAQELDKMNKATDNGRDASSVALYRRNIDRRLEQNPEVTPVVLKESDWGYGVMLGTGPRFATGSLNDNIGWSWDFNIALQGTYRRLRFMVDASFGAPTIKQPLLVTDKLSLADNYRANVKNADYIGVGFTLGYAVYDSRSFSVIPFAGGALTMFDWTVQPMEYDEEGQLVTTGEQKSIKLRDFNVRLGIDFQWHFGRTFWAFAGGTPQQELRSSLVVTPYAGYVKFSNTLPSAINGWQIGIRISYSALISALSNR